MKITCEGLNLNKEESTLELSKLKMTGAEGISRIMDLLNPKSVISKYRCNHRNENNTVCLIGGPTGHFTCSICGTTLKEIDVSDDELIAGSINNMKDILQMVKLLSSFAEVSEEEIHDISCTLDLLDRLPKLAEKANDAFERAESEVTALMSNPYRFPQTELVHGLHESVNGALIPKNLNKMIRV